MSARKTLKVSDPKVQIEMWQRNNYSPGKDPSLYGQFDGSYNSAVTGWKTYSFIGRESGVDGFEIDQQNLGNQ